MKPFLTFAAILVFAGPCCCGAFAQGPLSNLCGAKKTSSSCVTGAGAGSDMTANEPGGADGRRNSLLGEDSHSLYRLRSQDVIEVSFTVAPEFNQTLTVQPDGYVMLKDAGLVRAQGLDLQQFAEAVQKAYRGYLHDPQAAVALKDFEKPSFIVGGEVAKPGKYELRSDTTVIEAVEIAGGLTERAKHSQVVLFRKTDGDLVEARLLNVKKMLKQSSLREDAHLRPGDMVYVPQNSISKIAHFLSRPSVSMYMNSGQF